RLAAAEFFLRERSGYYIVLAGGRGKRKFSLTVEARASVAVESYVGARIRMDTDKRQAKAAGDTENALVLVAYMRFLPTGGVTIDLSGDETAHVEGRINDFRPYTGTIAKLASAQKLGLYLFSGPPPLIDNGLDAQMTIDAS